MDKIKVMDGKFLEIDKRDVPNKHDGRKLLKIINRNLKKIRWDCTSEDIIMYQKISFLPRNKPIKNVTLIYFLLLKSIFHVY